MDTTGVDQVSYERKYPLLTSHMGYGSTNFIRLHVTEEYVVKIICREQPKD